MPTPPEYETPADEITYEETGDTAPLPPPGVVPPVVPPPAPPGYPAGYPADEQVIVDDAGGTRVITRDARPPLPPEEDPRRWNWLTPALVFILLAALAIVLAAVLLTRDDNNDSNNNR